MPEATPVEPIPVGGAPLIGEVVEFDDDRGIGCIKIGDRTAPFHCTAITDGTRHIEVGTIVALRMAAGRLGRAEARWVRPLPGVATRGATVRSADGTVREPQVGPGPALGPLPSPPSAGDTPPSGTESISSAAPSSSASADTPASTV